jgi:hypothetical protein
MGLRAVPCRVRSVGGGQMEVAKFFFSLHLLVVDIRRKELPARSTAPLSRKEVSIVRRRQLSHLTQGPGKGRRKNVSDRHVSRAVSLQARSF